MKIAWAGFWFLTYWVPAGPVGDHQTLADYLEELKTGNLEYRAAYQRWQASLAEADAAGALPDPRVSLGVFLQEVETRVGPQKQRLSLGQTLPWKGKRKLAAARADARAAEEAATLDAVALRLTTEFKHLFAEYYYVGKAIGITQDHLELLNSLENVVSEKYRTNTAHYNDLIRIQVEIDQLGDRLATQRASAPPLVAAMNVLLGRPISRELPFPQTLPEAPLPPGWADMDLTPRLEAANPMLLKMDHRIEADRHAVALAGKNHFPDFHLGLDWTNTGEAIRPGTPGSGTDPFVLSVGINLPIWKKRYRALDAAAAARLQASQHQRDHARTQLQAGLTRSRFQLDDAERKIRLFRDQIIPKAEESLEVTLSAFQTGDVGYLDLIDAENALLEFQLSLNLAEASRLKALAAMEAVLGERPFQPSKNRLPDTEEE